MGVRRTAKAAQGAAVGGAVGAAGGWVASAIGATFWGGAGLLAFGPIVGGLFLAARGIQIALKEDDSENSEK